MKVLIVKDDKGLNACIRIVILFLSLACLSGIHWAYTVFVLGEEAFIYNSAYLGFLACLGAAGIFFAMFLWSAVATLIDKLAPTKRKAKRNGLLKIILLLALAYAGFSYWVFFTCPVFVFGIAWCLMTTAIIFGVFIVVIDYLVRAAKKMNMA